MSETITSVGTSANISAATAMRPGIAADMTGFVGIRLACTTALYRRLLAWPTLGLDRLRVAQVGELRPQPRTAERTTMSRTSRRC